MGGLNKSKLGELNASSQKRLVSKSFVFNLLINNAFLETVGQETNINGVDSELGWGLTESLQFLFWHKSNLSEISGYLQHN